MRLLLRVVVSGLFAGAVVSAPRAFQERKIVRTPGTLTQLPAAATAAGNWPQFRGTGAAGVADGQNLPDAWDIKTGENIVWRVPIPGLAHSSPIVWGDRIFVTTAVSSKSDATFVPGLYGAGTPSDDRTPQRLMLYAIDKRSGKVIWERLAYEGPPIEKRHMKNTYASASPATDGRIVVAWFGSQGVYAYHLDGTLRWKVDLGHLDVGAYNALDLEWGTASSPIIWNDLVFLQADTHKDSFVVALDVATGEVRWKADRVEPPSWGTPTVVTTAAGSQLVTNGSNFIRAYDPQSGKELWRLGRSSQITAPTPLFAEGLIVVSSGRSPERPIFVVRPTAKGDITLPEGETANSAVVWSRTGRGPYMPTPVIYNKTLYVLANNGVLHAYELATGKEIYETRVPMLGSGFSASPVAADGKIYVSGEDGDLMVFAAGSPFQHIATNQMGEPLMATPALSQGVLYVRTPTSLVAVGRADTPASDAERNRRGIGDNRPKNYIPWSELATAAATAGLTFSITSSVPRHAAFAGTWNASVRGVVTPMQVKLALDGTSVSGELINGPTTLKIIDGTVSGNRISFSVVAPTGNRTITFNGTLEKDEITFERTVRLHEGAATSAAGGAGLFGINGAPSFVARRVTK